MVFVVFFWGVLGWVGVCCFVVFCVPGVVFGCFVLGKNLPDKKRTGGGFYKVLCFKSSSVHPNPFSETQQPGGTKGMQCFLEVHRVHF